MGFNGNDDIISTNFLQMAIHVDQKWTGGGEGGGGGGGGIL